MPRPSGISALTCCQSRSAQNYAVIGDEGLRRCILHPNRPELTRDVCAALGSPQGNLATCGLSGSQSHAAPRHIRKRRAGDVGIGAHARNQDVIPVLDRAWQCDRIIGHWLSQVGPKTVKAST